VKFVALSLPCLLSMAATCALYGWLESTANMIEGLRLLFAPGATTVVLVPFLLLFIALTLIIFVAAPMFAAAIGAIFGGLLLRWRALSVSRSTIRSFVFASVVCHIIFGDACLTPQPPIGC
jgi:hypothetical protein